MLSTLRKFYFFLDSGSSAKLAFLLVVIVLMSLLEVAGIASIFPFLQLASNPDATLENRVLGWVKRTFTFDNHDDMLMFTGLSVVAFLVVSSGLGAFSVWQRQRIAWSLAHNLSMKLIRSYSELPYEFFLHHTSADLIKKIIDDVNSLVTGVVLAGSQFLCQIIISTLILGLVMLIDPWTAVGAFGLISLFYTVLFFCRKRYLTDLGRERLAMNLLRYKTFVDLMTGIRTIKSDGSLDFFENRFEVASKRFAEIHPKVQFAAAVPRYAVEAVAFGSIILVTLFLVSSGGNFQKALPKLTLFALAGYRLLPTINGCYNSLVQVISNYTAIESIYDDLLGSDANRPDSKIPLQFENAIQLKNISFRYKETNDGIDNVSIKIRPNEKIAFVGPSGSGKSTLANVLMGLLTHQNGQILVDGVSLDQRTLDSWRSMIGYVPQDVFLFDATIEQNVAFGTEPVDDEKLKAALKAAQLTSFIESLPDQQNTLVGEAGIRLSGGQRQRIGLARALYRQPRILILDEATSALDSGTEKLVIDSICNQLNGITIAMIAHRMSTVRQCDRLYVLDRGQLVAEGTYESLLNSSQLFRELASLN